MSSNQMVQCLNFSNTQYLVLTGIKTGSSIISVLCCLLVLVIMILLKRYMFFVHRLAMYLTITTLVNSVVRSINVYPPNIVQNIADTAGWDDYCKVLGFLDQYTMWCVLLAVVCITLEIFMRASCKFKTYKMEPMYVIVIFLLPSLFNWVPFTVDAYGNNGVWCWIREQNSTCSKFNKGLVLRLALLEVPQLVIMTVLALLIIVTYTCMYQKRYQYEGMFDPHQQALRRKERMEILPFLYYPMVLILLEIFPVTHTLYDIWYPDSEFILWLLNVLTGPFEGAAISLIYLLEPDTRQRLSWTRIRAATKGWCHRNRAIREYPAEVDYSGDSRHSSIQTYDTDILVTNYHQSIDNDNEG